MELQFQNKPLSCLRSILWGVKSSEQTQEVKLPEAMPDVAKVLGTWGQCLLRGKEWQSGRMGASGGVAVWVLYAPEDGTFPRVVEAWIPWQLHWELPPTQRDGTMCIQTVLKSVDARVVGARKLMVRACVEAAGEALEPVQVEVFTPGPVPENLYLLRRKYPMCIPTEAGEKPVTLEETLELPPECGENEKLIHYSLLPKIHEEKLVGNRLLFRGIASLQGICRDPEGEFHGFSYDLPFSQYADLESANPADPVLQVVPTVTELELDILEGKKLALKAALIGQYLVCRQQDIEVVEDAYSLGAQVKLLVQPLLIPAVLEAERQTMQVTAESDIQPETVISVPCNAGQPEIHRDDAGANIKVSGVFPVLYRDMENGLQSAAIKWEQTQQIPADPGTAFGLWLQPDPMPDAVVTGKGLQIRADLSLCSKSIGENPIPMVTGLEIKPEEGETARPCLILRRGEGDTLWEMAKTCGSMEEAIRQANGLTEEPEPDRMLLIPVI